MPEKPLVVSTIVTTPMMGAIAESYGCEYRETLTGFKWISAIIRECEESETGHQFLFGAEESFGYMAGDYVRDKDGVSATCLLVEAAALAKKQGKNLIDKLDELYRKHGYFESGLQNFFFEGKAGKEKIASIMQKLRDNPPEEIAGHKVVRMDDVQRSVTTRGGEEVPLVLPQSNVLIYYLEGGGRLAARPSGTEPKVKFYSTARVAVEGDDLAGAQKQAEELLAPRWSTAGSPEAPPASRRGMQPRGAGVVGRYARARAASAPRSSSRGTKGSEPAPGRMVE